MHTIYQYNHIILHYIYDMLYFINIQLGVLSYILTIDFMS